MKVHAPRLLLAAPASGSGKTTVVCALLKALLDRGLNVRAFKCGPDYIDPMFHSKVIGVNSSNLDVWMLGRETVSRLLAENSQGSDISVIEGVMGYYDGVGFASSEASSYDVAVATSTPVILVIDGRGMSRSVLATIRGFCDFENPSGIAGVIIDNVNRTTYERMKEIIEAETGVRSCGFLPRLPDVEIPSRHLGLVTADEIADLSEKIARLGAAALDGLDLDALLSIAACASDLEYEPRPSPRGEPVRLGVARDDAFCFYYSDSLTALEDAGARIVEFSPTRDRLPDVDGVYLGGGYPELYARELSGNVAMREDLRRFVDAGAPVFAECGGFMYLTEGIVEDGVTWPMTGIFPGVCSRSSGLVRFGYATLTAGEDTLLLRAGESVRVHEFHHYDCQDPGDAFDAVKPDGRAWKTHKSKGNVLAGFPHVHFASNPELARRFVAACASWRREVRT
jgi:cobyrinic acid a,c-diamide synthase